MTQPSSNPTEVAPQPRQALSPFALRAAKDTWCRLCSIDAASGNLVDAAGHALNLAGHAIEDLGHGDVASLRLHAGTDVRAIRDHGKGMLRNLRDAIIGE